MKIETHTIAVESEGKTDILNLSDQIQELVSAAGVKEGSAVVFAVGSTAGITTIEFEPGLVEHDVRELLQKSWCPTKRITLTIVPGETTTEPRICAPLLSAAR